MKNLKIIFSMVALVGGIGGALASKAPGDPIMGPAYLSIDGQCQYVQECDGGNNLCTVQIDGLDHQLFWDVENQFGQPSGTCAKIAYRP